jgi:hypothetical protein
MVPKSVIEPEIKLALAEIAIAVARRDVKATAKRNGKVREIAANPDMLIYRMCGGAA